MKYWEIIADNLKKRGWSWGCVSAIDSNGRTIWIADAHRGDGKRFCPRPRMRVRFKPSCLETDSVGRGNIRAAIAWTRYKSAIVLRVEGRSSGHKDETENV